MTDPAKMAAQYIKTAKSVLHEYFQVHNGVPQFTTDTATPFNPIQPDFQCCLTIPAVATQDGTQSQTQFTAHGRTKKAAEHAAAEAALDYLTAVGKIPRRGVTAAQPQPAAGRQSISGSQPFVFPAAAPSVPAANAAQGLQVVPAQQTAQSPAEAMSPEELASISAWIDQQQPDDIKRLLIEARQRIGELEAHLARYVERERRIRAVVLDEDA